MRRKGYFSKHIATKKNFEDAFNGYADQKHSRKDIQVFEKDLGDNLLSLLRAYDAGTWQTSPYEYKFIDNPKPRKISKLKPADHVIQWAASLQYEPYMISSLYWKSCSCVPGKGTHYFVKIEKKDLYYAPQKETYYFVQLDMHHYFLHIYHPLMKEKLERKIKDPKLLSFLFEIIDSFLQGLPLGIKISQLNANMYLSAFDWKAIKCFGIAEDTDKMSYWRDRYVTDKLLTCRTGEQAAELSRGVQFLNSQFDRFAKQGLKHYARFADNIIIMHQDKVFLRIISELAIMYLTRDCLLTVNGWNVRPVHAGGIDVCGYVFFHDHLRLRKRNKQSLCRQVAKLKKKGYSKRDIQLKCASRIGFAMHADTRNLLKKLDIDMEKRLGKVITNRRKKAPFEGMAVEQKKLIEEIVCLKDEDEEKKLIRLLDYKIDDSIIEKNKDGSPKQRIAIRYNVIDHVEHQEGEEDPIYIWGSEYYSFSGSKVMIDQAETDFSKKDLPSPTVIKEFTNKQKKKFYKFT